MKQNRRSARDQVQEMECRLLEGEGARDEV
jgi:hypothetical protein